MTDEPILSTKDRAGTFDAIETAKPNEPLFALQGGDPFAPATILFWADLARKAGLAEHRPADAHRLMKKASAAEFVAWAMQSYQRGEGAAEIEASAREEALLATDRNSALAKGANRLNNALAEAIDVADMLDATDEVAMKVHAARLRDISEYLRDISEAIEPRRHMRR